MAEDGVVTQPAGADAVDHALENMYHLGRKHQKEIDLLILKEADSTQEAAQLIEAHNARHFGATA